MKRDTTQLLPELQTIFREVLDNEQLALTAHTTANEVAEWDSVSHLMLLHAIERRFAIKFDLQEIITFRNAGDIAESVLAKTDK